MVISNMLTPTSANSGRLSFSTGKQRANTTIMHCLLVLFVFIQLFIRSVCADERKYGKIAFLFMTRGPMPLEDLWATFFDWKADPKDYSVYVHTQPGFKYSNDSIFYGKNKDLDKPVEWGKMSQVLGIKRLVRQALQDPLNERFCLMSESCIPLVPFRKWQSVMFNHSKSILNACPMEGMEENRWHKDLDQTNITVKHWRKSATWFALNRKHAEIFVNETETESAWNKVMCVDEHYLPTILANRGLDNETTCSDGFAYVHWPSAIAAHPSTFSGTDITKSFLRALERPIDYHHTTSQFSQTCSGYDELCHFTARKFSSSALVPLLMHAKMLFGEEGAPFEAYQWGRYIRKFRRAVQNDGTEALYLVDNGQIRAMPDEATKHAFLHMVRFQDANQEIPLLSEADRAANYMGNPFPTRRDRTVYKVGRNPELWYMKNGHRRSIPDMDTFFKLNCTLEKIRQIAQADIDLIPLGVSMPKLEG